MRIIIVEDNVILAKGIAHRLRDSGHAVELLHDGQAAASFVQAEPPDLLILDVNLPGKSGFEILTLFRQTHTSIPVLMLTARSTTEDRVKGLDAGADDYLVKPFEMDELDARVRALLRRKQRHSRTTEQIGQIEFDRQTRQLLDNTGQTLTLRRKELAVFECLFDRLEQLVPKSTLLDQVYGIGADVDEKSIEIHVSRLRKALAPFDVDIKVARGLGYMLQAKQ